MRNRQNRDFVGFDAQLPCYLFSDSGQRAFDSRCSVGFQSVGEPFEF
jgi:hypothetical protein